VLLIKQLRCKFEIWHEIKLEDECLNDEVILVIYITVKFSSHNICLVETSSKITLHVLKKISSCVS
jgi:hypothetical protein